MKNLVLILLMAISFGFYSCSNNADSNDSANSQNISTASFKVRGNCEMCKERIEETVNGIDGVEKATWEEKTQMLTVSFDSTMVKEKNIHLAVAEVGHETSDASTPDGVDEALPMCCRKKKI